LTSFFLTRISSVAPASRTPSWPERSKQAVAEHLRLALLIAGQVLPAVANEVSELGRSSAAATFVTLRTLRVAPLGGSVSVH
jgi:hypothetical protein